jgi:hypothetical protein
VASAALGLAPLRHGGHTLTPTPTGRGLPAFASLSRAGSECSKQSPASARVERIAQRPVVAPRELPDRRPPAGEPTIPGGCGSAFDAHQFRNGPGVEDAHKSAAS